MNLNEAFYNRIYKYLGLKVEPTKEQLDMIEQAVNEVKKLARPGFVHKFFALTQTNGSYAIKNVELSIDYSSLQGMLRKSSPDAIMIIASTLGLAVDTRIAYYGVHEPSRMVLLDAVASSYIELITDEYQEKLSLKNPTFRFAPGYGNVPLSVQREIFDLLPEIRTIGIDLDDGNMMHPFKSMTGFVGFNVN